MSRIRESILVGSRIQLTLTTSRVCKVVRFSESNDIMLQIDTRNNFLDTTVKNYHLFTDILHNSGIVTITKNYFNNPMFRRMSMSFLRQASKGSSGVEKPSCRYCYRESFLILSLRICYHLIVPVCYLLNKTDNHRNQQNLIEW